MKKPSLAAALAGAALLIAPAAAFAQVVPGQEIVGHSINLTAAGVRNPVHFDAGGHARIVTPKGNVVPATWTTANQSLCLAVPGAQECWPYLQPFQTGVAVNLTSDAQVPSTWVPNGANPVSTMPPPAPPAPGERG